MDRKDLIKQYLDFFKYQGHKEIPNASLIPENDPTVLFTTAGMHPLVPYLIGQRHPLGKRLVGVQRCIRTGDIEEVGDDFHLTLFEMLGNWSLGDYWKEEAISWSYEFLTKILWIPKEKISVTCFKGDENAPQDKESEKSWKKIGIDKIRFLEKKDNWWGPAGKTGPCGPDSEIFYWIGKGKPILKNNSEDEKNWVEIWNNVFMQYNKTKEGKYEPLLQKNVDTGMGVERTITILNNLNDVYETPMFKPIIQGIEKLSGKKYKENKKAMRIITDHIRASLFIIGDGIIPGNTEQGYVLRRLIRRAIRYGEQIGLRKFIAKVAEPIFSIYSDYPELKQNQEKIIKELKEEEERFLEVIERGLIKLKKLIEKKETISGKDAFLMYQSYGFPIELTQEIAKEKGINVNLQEFEKEEKKHQELSRTATKGRFKAGLADNSEQSKMLHTATHMLHKALREVLGEHVHQMGSNITPERLRFDFSYSQKLTPEEIKKVEDIVNEQIKKELPVSCEEMPYKKAVKTGALSFFKERYPEIVKVYSIGNFSKEVCTGPHVDNTKEIRKFKIIKEESSSAGVRRIKAIVG